MYLAATRPQKVRRPEIIAGLFREGQIVTLAGEMSAGKTPLLKDWAVAVASGQQWCGCDTLQRPVMVLDFESDDCQFEENLNAIITRRELAATPLPIRLLLKNGPLEDPATQDVQSLEASHLGRRVAWIEEKLAEYPSALFIIDPIQLVFNVEKNKSEPVVALFKMFRSVQLKYRSATFVFTYNLRKRDLHAEMPPLLEDPQGWLQELSGTLDIQNRSDVRLGLAFLKKGERDVLVLNGLRRGETIEPMVLEIDYLPGAYDSKGKPVESGFTRVPAASLDVAMLLTPRMMEAWEQMDGVFVMDELVAVMPRGSAYRLVTRAVASGLLRKNEDGGYTKV